MSGATDRIQDALAQGDRDRAVHLAQAAALESDADALAMIAQWRLVGSVLPRDLPEARRFLRLAVQAGHASSALTEAALTANGTGGSPDWPSAMQLLRDAANRFGGEASRHLALLDAMDVDEQGTPRRSSRGEVLSDTPRVVRWQAAVSPDECAHLAMSVQDLMEPSMVADPRTGRLVAHPVRRSSAAVIGPTRETLPIQAIQRRIAAFTDTDVRQGEPLSVLHYAPSQEYRTHMDALPNEANQRVATVLIYLNTGYSGGQTHFPATGLTIAGGGGDVVTFTNVLPDGSPDPATRHASLPIQRGAKWLATRWIRARPFDVWNPSS